MFLFSHLAPALSPIPIKATLLSRTAFRAVSNVKNGVRGHTATHTSIASDHFTVARTSYNLRHRPFHTSPATMADSSKTKSESEWRAVLTPQQVRQIETQIARARSLICGARAMLQFRILREKGTEPAGTGKYDKHYEEGVYACAGCGTPLYKSVTKFKSGCGWPAFFDGTSRRGPAPHALVSLKSMRAMLTSICARSYSWRGKPP